MNAVLLKRLFRAVSAVSDPNLEKVATAIVHDERQKGHDALARQLEEILSSEKSEHHSPLETFQPAISKSNALSSLPLSRRYHDPLASFVVAENLRHHMVLPAAVEERFYRIEREYAARERLALHGLQPRRKILLYGSPGCGKSLGAERLAWKTGLPLMKVRFDAMMSSYFGESASNLRQVFEKARDIPCLLFLDECDFVARSRTNNNDVGEAPRIVNTLLQLLEDYDAPGLLVAATNLGSTLDEAIFRRFDDVFEVPLPGDQQICQLLKLTLASINVALDIEWDCLVHLLEGHSAANVVNAAQNAARSAILSSQLPVTQKHLEKAIKESVTAK